MATPDNDEPVKSEPTTGDFIHKDIADSPRDAEKLKNEEVILDLPEVKDIPGQEHIQVPSLDALGDTTASSDDEEGVGLLDDLNEDEETEPADGSEADVTPLEKDLLQAADEDQPTTDDQNLKDSYLDETDDDGDPINEGSMATDVSGDDLDTATADDENDNAELGEEDEENDTYGLGGDDNDEPPQDQF